MNVRHPDPMCTCAACRQVRKDLAEQVKRKGKR